MGIFLSFDLIYLCRNQVWHRRELRELLTSILRSLSVGPDVEPFTRTCGDGPPRRPWNPSEELKRGSHQSRSLNLPTQTATLGLGTINMHMALAASTQQPGSVACSPLAPASQHRRHSRVSLMSLLPYRRAAGLQIYCRSCSRLRSVGFIAFHLWLMG